MNKIEKLKSKIVKIELILNEIKEELTSLEKELNITKKSKKIEDFPPPEIFKKEYEELYEKFLKENSKSVKEFINSKSLKYLLKFCQINNIVIDSKKRSKTKIANELIQWFVQRKAITKKV